VLPKPAHLGPQYAATFQDRSIVAAYHHRPPYPEEVFEILDGLIAGAPDTGAALESRRTVLDVGCGTGDIARRLAPRVERMDAVDVSAGMIAKGQQLPGGTDPRLRWIVGRVEEVALEPPYALVTAGESLHWMDWAVALPRLREMLAPGGYVVIVERAELPMPWTAAMSELLVRYSTNREYKPYDLVEELKQRGLFASQGTRRTRPMQFRQSVESYVECMHSRQGFSRDRMTVENAAAFDAALSALVARSSAGGQVELQVVGVMSWGFPAPAPR
jgi:SAM-dependent methyltransferase